MTKVIFYVSAKQLQCLRKLFVSLQISPQKCQMTRKIVKRQDHHRSLITWKLKGGSSNNIWHEILIKFHYEVKPDIVYFHSKFSITSWCYCVIFLSDNRTTKKNVNQIIIDLVYQKWVAYELGCGWTSESANFSHSRCVCHEAEMNWVETKKPFFVNYFKIINNLKWFVSPQNIPSCSFADWNV